MSDHRPRRSVLYMPGANERALDKARSLPADALILDLEDAVAPDAKEAARNQVAATVRQGGYGAREVVIRINGSDTPWGAADMEMAVSVRPDAILVPKINTPENIRRTSDAMTQVGAETDLPLWVMMETPRAMLNAAAIAHEAESKNARLSVFVMGTNDLVKEIGATHTPERTSVLGALSHCLLAARTSGLCILDGVYNDIKDEAGFEAVCQQGADMGFDGKTLIHPSQIVTCNRIFSPDEQEVSEARAILAAFDKPENAGKGVLSVDGRMVELLHADMARRIVAIADTIAALEGES
ncbi:MAG: CoA ester lyase [Parvularculales bacterium]